MFHWFWTRLTLEGANLSGVDLLYFVHELFDVPEGFIEERTRLLHGKQIERNLLVTHLDHFLLHKIKPDFLRIYSIGIQGRCIVANLSEIQVKQTILGSFLATWHNVIRLNKRLGNVRVIVLVCDHSFVDDTIIWSRSYSGRLRLVKIIVVRLLWDFWILWKVVNILHVVLSLLVPILLLSKILFFLLVFKGWHL